MRAFTSTAVGLGEPEWRQIELLADELDGRSLLPITGAGASIGCDVTPKVPSAGDLEKKLRQAVEGGLVPLSPLPSDFSELKDLGVMAEAVHLQNGTTTVLETLGFDDLNIWPPATGVNSHPCAYRVLARMARERIIEETLTFNYDCHNEAACRTEGFLPRDHRLEAQVWPSRYGVIASAKSNASLRRRADFTVVKAHGCIELWRQEIAEAKTEEEADQQSEAIVVRRSQLLDWRGDFWARDLLADRARRNVLLLIGCSMQDPVIQISLKRLMDEVRSVDADGPVRVRVLDIDPGTLSLRTILAAAGSTGSEDDRERCEVQVPGKNENHELGGMLLALLTTLLARTLKSAPTPWASALPTDIGSRTTLLAETAPVMARWSWWFRGKSRLGEMGLGVDLKRGGDDCYVPLLADPFVTLRATMARTRLLQRLGRGLEANPAEVSRSGFVISPRHAAAVMPLGIGEGEFEAASDLVREAASTLNTPKLELYVALAERISEEVVFFSCWTAGRPNVTLFETVFARLSEVKLTPQRGSIAPFGQELPLVSGWLADRTTGMVALIAECEEAWNGEPWRDLLFAVSGMRHSLSDGEGTATSPPIVLALVKSQGDEENLRALVEELTSEYLLFTRIDLSLVSAERVFGGDGELLEGELDQALAPLLPVCREALLKNWTVDSGALHSFRAKLSAEVDKCAAELESEPWGKHAVAARDSIRERICAAVVMPEERLAPGQIWSHLRIQDFRAAEDLPVALQEATIVEGLNGTGKSSLFEALEILWSGASSRKPDGVKAEDYEKHLPRAGEPHFLLEGRVGDGKPVTCDRLDFDAVPLRRSVLHQDSVGRFVELSPRERYSWFLRQAGLEMPDIREARKELESDEQDALNESFKALGIPLIGRERRADKKLEEWLGRVDDFELAWPPRSLQFRDQVEKVAAKYGFRCEGEPEGRDLFNARLGDFVNRCREVARQFRADAELTSLATSLSRDIREKEQEVRELGDAVRALMAALNKHREPVEPPPLENRPEVPQPLAASWLRSARDTTWQADKLRECLDEISSEEWRRALRSYVDALDVAAESVPLRELAQLAEADSSERVAEGRSIDPRLFEAVGLFGEGSGEFKPPLHAALADLAKQLDEEATELFSIGTRVGRHPAVRLHGREEDLFARVARFELARKLKKPIELAEAGILEELVRDGGLQAVFRELVAALTRFEWYFKPAKLRAQRKQLDVDGLVVDDPKLELRMLLNSGESAIVGISWFLAQHLLQEETQRRLLLLDDPFAGLDANNRAAVLATVRTYARLVCPDFFMLSTHDEVFAQLLQQEFGSIAGWPERLGHLRFKRAPNNSLDFEDLPVSVQELDFEAELSRLGAVTGHADLP